MALDLTLAQAKALIAAAHDLDDEDRRAWVIPLFIAAQSSSEAVRDYAQAPASSGPSSRERDNTADAFAAFGIIPE